MVYISRNEVIIGTPILTTFIRLLIATYKARAEIFLYSVFEVRRNGRDMARFSEGSKLQCRTVFYLDAVAGGLR